MQYNWEKALCSAILLRTTKDWNNLISGELKPSKSVNYDEMRAFLHSDEAEMYSTCAGVHRDKIINQLEHNKRKNIIIEENKFYANLINKT